MNFFFTARRTTARRTRMAVSRLFALAAIVILVGSGQAAAAPGILSPAGTPAYAESVVRSVGDYWGRQLRPGWGFRYWISHGVGSVASPCGVRGDPDARPGATPASYCGRNNTVYLSSSWLFDHASNNGTTPYGVAVVIAHEVGHAVQAELGLGPRSRWVEPEELQADCFAGAWVGYRVRNGQASATDVGDARRQVWSGGDYNEGSPGHHGTPVERVDAWRTGLRGGSSACRR